MFDIAEQLFPNIVTIFVQLCATGVIYLLYRKYLHQKVLIIMDKKADDFQTEYTQIEAMKKEQQLLEEKFNKEKSLQRETFDLLEKQMMDNIENTRKKMLLEVENEMICLKEKTKKELEEEQYTLLKSLEKQTVTIASQMVAKVLEGYTFDEEQIIKALESEMKQLYEHS